jgi:hypothetical protein
MPHPFQFLDFLQPPTVPVAAVELGREEGARELGGELGAHDLGAETEDVHVVVLDALVRGVRVMADRGTDPGQLVRRDGGAHAGAAHEDTALGLASEDRLTDLPSLVGVVDPRLRCVRPEVEHLMTLLGDRVADALTQLDTTVVEGYGDAHRMGTLPA